MNIRNLNLGKGIVTLTVGGIVLIKIVKTQKQKEYKVYSMSSEQSDESKSRDKVKEKTYIKKID